jgi:hypothetical protein
MRKFPFVLALTIVASTLSETALFAVDLRANDQVPPVPPGNSFPPPATSNPPSTSSTTQTSAGNKKQGGHMDKLKQELGLTPAQVNKIKPILERTAQQVKTLRSSVSLSAAQKKQQIRQLHLAAFEQIRPILTPQQVQKWKQIRQQHGGPQQAQTAAN